jgi:hypothetical protein
MSYCKVRLRVAQERFPFCQNFFFLISSFSHRRERRYGGGKMEKRRVACEDGGSEERVRATRQSREGELFPKREEKCVCKRQQQRTVGKQIHRQRETITTVICASGSSVREKEQNCGVGVEDGFVCGRDLVSRIKNMTLFIRGPKIRGWGGRMRKRRRKSGQRRANETEMKNASP